MQLVWTSVFCAVCFVVRTVLIFVVSRGFAGGCLLISMQARSSDESGWLYLFAFLQTSEVHASWLGLPRLTVRCILCADSASF